MNLRFALAPFIFAVTCVSPALGQASFRGIGVLSQNVQGSLANGISKDGRVVVGESFVSTGSRAIRWTAEQGIVNLGLLPGGSADSHAYGVSADGSVIVGQSDDGSFAEGGTAFRWTAATGMQPLGDLGGPTNYGYASGTSDDGSIIVGSMDDGSPSPFGGIGFQAFRWTASTGMQPFGQGPGGMVLGAAAITSDGSRAWSSFNYTSTYLWSRATGWVRQPDEFNVISWMRDDGLVMFTTRCGQGPTSSCPRAHRWTPTTGFVDLGFVHGATERGDTALRGVSQDGSVAVGIGNFDPDDDNAGIAFIWDTQHGIRVLTDVLVNQYQLTQVLEWGQLEPTGMSADGLVICGIGFSPEGIQEGWVANLRGATPLCPGDFNHSGSVTVQDVFDFLGAFFTLHPEADVNGRDGITVQDVFDFLTAFFTPCP
jgi:probable HAF family extracellular repeat protein